MGAVVVDVLQDQLEFRKILFFFVNIAPFLMLALICIIYLINILGHLRRDLFGSFSIFYVVVVFFTICYCTFCKYTLYLNGKK